MDAVKGHGNVAFYFIDCYYCTSKTIPEMFFSFPDHFYFKNLLHFSVNACSEPWI